MGRIPLRRKDWPINIDFEQDAAKKFRKWYPFMHTYVRVPFQDYITVIEFDL